MKVGEFWLKRGEYGVKVGEFGLKRGERGVKVGESPVSPPVASPALYAIIH